MSPLVKRALDRAATWHREQLRKYPGVTVPYMSHLAGVAALLARHGFDDEVVAAGALHDAIEDAGVRYEELVALFGERVADLVRGASESDRSLPWEERKRRYVEAFASKSWEVQAISLADKIDNLYSILVCLEDHGDPWPLFKRGREAQLANFAALEGKLEGLAPHALIQEYRAALAKVRSRS